MKENKAFTHSYSAAENLEIKRIRDKYSEPDKNEANLVQLRKLDASVHSKAAAFSVSAGIIGALLLGAGMSCVMVWQDNLFVPSIILGISGIIITVLAYPLYKIKADKARKKIAPVILKITDELLK